MWIRFLTILVIVAGSQNIVASASGGVCEPYYRVKESSGTRWENESEIEKRHLISCSTSCVRAKEIYDNCIVNLMPNGKVEPTKRQAIWGKCKRAACEPSFFDNLRYWPILCLVGSLRLHPSITRPQSEARPLRTYTPPLEPIRFRSSNQAK